MSKWDQFKLELYEALRGNPVQAFQGRARVELRGRSTTITMDYLGQGAFGQVWKVFQSFPC
jgi:hypothetical protein